MRPSLARRLGARPREAGLDRDGYALCHEVATVAIERFGSELGILSAERIDEIDRALAAALDLPA